MVTLKEHVSVFPVGSVDVYVTVVVPMGKVLPGVWDGDSVWLPELSVAVGSVQVTFAVAAPGSVDPNWSPGHPGIVGLSLSDEYE